MNIVEYAKLRKMLGGGGTPSKPTAIPTGKVVDKIYFNANLSNEQVDAYLSQLTYVDIGVGNPLNLLYVQTSDYNGGIFVFAGKFDDGYGIFCWNTVSTQSGTVMYTSTSGVAHDQLISGDTKVFIPYVQYDLTCEEPILNDFMGVPIGAENEKIKNVLSITPFGTSATSGASAYTVSSVDELPSNAVDGSIAIVNETVINDGAGTWVFHDELDNLIESYNAWANNNGYCSFEILFSSFGQSYEGFRASPTGSSSWGIYGLTYCSTDDVGIAHTTAYTYNPSGNYGIAHGWAKDAFKTIEVSYLDREAKRWLEAHATQLTNTDFADVIVTLYVRENGEWVLKGEVA